MKMEEVSISELEALVQTTLSNKRCRHVLNVRETAVKLAKQYGADVRRCEIAALLHDITKEMERGKQLQMLEASGIMSDMVVLKSPPLYHAYTGAIYAEKTLGITDETVLNAIRYHTVARAGMSPEEKIVYLADAISKDRSYPGVEGFGRLHEGDAQAHHYVLSQRRVPASRYHHSGVQSVLWPVIGNRAGFSLRCSRRITHG